MRFQVSVPLAFVLSLGLLAHSTQAADETASTMETLNPVLVTGESPGPAIWKLTRPDNDHVLWIIGGQPLMPEGVNWRSQTIETLASQSQAIVVDGGFSITADGKVGFFRAVSLVPAILSARKNPNGEALAELVPPDVYARWLVQKKRYLGRDRSIEKWRPTFAAESLRQEAMESIKRSKSPSLWGVLTKIAKAKQIKMVYPRVAIKIPPKEMRGKIKLFAKQSMQDVECFERNVAFVEALDNKATIRARAIAWSVGDVDALRGLPGLPRFNDACNASLASSQVATEFHLENLSVDIRQRWLAAIESNVAENAATIALLPIDDLFATDGRLALLREKGFLVEEPSRK